MSHVALMFVESPIRTCAMTHSYVWHDAFIRVTWLVCMRGMTRSYAWHDICILWHDAVVCVPWRIRACDMAHTRVAESIRPSTLTHTRVDSDAPYCSHMQCTHYIDSTFTHMSILTRRFWHPAFFSYAVHANLFLKLRSDTPHWLIYM